MSEHAPGDAPQERDVAAAGGVPWRAYIQLMRLPAVFTALADICLGFLLTHAHPGDAPQTLVLLLVTSAALYLAGMVFNDVFDRAVDAVERPQRPIPSGRVSLPSAVRLGGVLVAVGLVSATALRWVDPAQAGWNPLFIAALLTGGIFLYDGVLKSTLLGPVSMGLCRFFNVLLGASAGGMELGQPFENPQRWIAAGLAVYIAGVTWFARTEATDSRRGSLIGALLVVNAGMATLMGWVVSQPVKHGNLPLLLLAVIAVSVNRRMLVAVVAPSPQAVQGTVRTLLLTIITLDAAMIFAATGNIMLATVIAVGLILPALLVGRAIRIT